MVLGLRQRSGSQPRTVVLGRLPAHQRHLLPANGAGAIGRGTDSLSSRKARRRRRRVGRKRRGVDRAVHGIQSIRRQRRCPAVGLAAGAPTRSARRPATSRMGIVRFVISPMFFPNILKSFFAPLPHQVVITQLSISRSNACLVYFLFRLDC